MNRDQPEQQDLLPGLVRSAGAKPGPKPRKAVEIAEVDPVARVLVDVPLAHLDRPFDYAVPATMAENIAPGVRVKVRFAGQDVDGYVVARAASSDHAGRLTPVRRVVSAEPVLSAEVAELTGRRRAAVRRHPVRRPSAGRPAPSRNSGEGCTARGHDPPPEIAAADLARPGSTTSPVRRSSRVSSAAIVAARRLVGCPRHGLAGPVVGRRGRDVRRRSRRVIVVPDGRDVDRVDSALTDLLGPGHHVALRADSGPSARYRDFLAVSRGGRRIVVGTRSAAFAPVHDLGLVAIWDDGDDLHSEPRAPYPHAREVLLLRADAQDTARPHRRLRAHGRGRIPPAHRLGPGARAHARPGPRAGLGLGDRSHRTRPGSRSLRAQDAGCRGRRTRRSAAHSRPGRCWCRRPGRATPRRLACERCRTPARCATCSGPLRLTGPSTVPACRWCGTEAAAWACAACGHRGLRAPVVGDARTAEELGRSFAGVRVLTSSAGSVLTTVGDQRCIVVATPGAEPVAPPGLRRRGPARHLAGPVPRRPAGAGGGRRRWLNAAALARPGGHVVAVGDPADPGPPGAGPLGPRRVRAARDGRTPVRPSAARQSARDGDGGAIGGRGRPRPRWPCRPRPRCSGPSRPATTTCAPSSGCRARTGRRSRPRSVTCNAPGRAASSPPYASRWILRRSAEPYTCTASDQSRASPARGSRTLAIQPIRLFGDPILRKPAVEVIDFDKELRKLVEDLTDTMIDAPGAGLAAPQIGVGLRVFTWFVEGEPGHLVNPTLELSEEIQDGLEGCLSLPELTFECKRAMSVVAQGFNMYGDPVTVEGSEMLARAIQHETDHLDGVMFIDRLDTESRKAAMKAIRESEWFGTGAPCVQGLATPHQRARPLMRVVFAGTPEVALPALDAIADSGHDLVGVVTRPDAPSGRGRRLVASPIAQRAEELGVPVLRPAHPRDPAFQAELQGPRARLLPGRRVRRDPPSVGPRHPAARLGQPALLLPACLARRGAGAARDLGGRRGHRRHHLPHRQGARRRPRLRRDDRADPARRTRPVTCWPGSPRAAPGCWSPPSTALPRVGSRPAPSRPRGSASHRRSSSRTPGSTGPNLRSPSTGGSGPAPRSRERGPCSTDCGSRSVRSRSSPGSFQPGGSRSPSTLCGSGPRPTRFGSARSSLTARKQMNAADWARGVTFAPGARFGD